VEILNVSVMHGSSLNKAKVQREDS